MCSLYRNEYKNLKIVKVTMGRGQRGVKRTGRDEPIGVVMHIHMETTQGISLHSYLYLKLAKTPCFSYYLLCFFFYKIQESKLEAKPWQKVSKTISLQTQSGMVLHTCNPSYAESIYRRIRVQEWHQANDKGQ
jgi:hypothetical protein